MKKVLLLAVTASISVVSFAQKAGFSKTKNVQYIDNAYTPIGNPSGTAAKTTGVGDTIALTHIGSLDTLTIYSASGDSGYVAGTDAFGDKGFAERYDFKASDSTLKVIGVIALFGGKISPISIKTVTFNVWSQGAKSVSFRPTIFNNGLPASSLTSRSVPITQLGISMVDTANDTTKSFLFATPTAFLTDSFFVGYTINYTWAAMAGDTLGLYSNQDGERTEPGYFAISTSDTTINNVNVTQYADNSWHDNNIENFGIFNNLFIFPIVIVGPGTSTAVSGITRNDFTFYGNYPNPASDATNVKIALAHSADVTIDIMDVTGKAIKTVTSKNLSVGEHLISVISPPANTYTSCTQAPAMV